MTTPRTQDLFHLGDGRVVVEAGWGKLAAAWLVDTLVAWVVFTGLVLGIRAATSPDPAVVVLLLMFPLGVLLYGLATGHRRSLGQRLVGTRTLRCVDGSIPGYWRAGWVMVVRLVLVPFLLGIMLIALLTGEDADGGEQWHVSVDLGKTARIGSSLER